MIDIVRVDISYVHLRPPPHYYLAALTSSGYCQGNRFVFFCTAFCRCEEEKEEQTQLFQKILFQAPSAKQ